jgi:hypothetical protein
MRSAKSRETLPPLPMTMPQCLNHDEFMSELHRSSLVNPQLYKKGSNEDTRR